MPILRPKPGIPQGLREEPATWYGELGEELGRGAESAIQGYKADTFRALQAAGSLVGSEDLQQYGEERAREYEAAAEPFAPAVPTIEQINTAIDALKWGAYNIASAGAYAVPMATGGLAGTAVGALARAPKVGGLAGAYLSSATPQAGETYREIKEESGIDAPGASILGGMARGAVEMSAVTGAVRRALLPGTRSLGSNVLGQGVHEAGTEALQEGIGMTTRGMVDPNYVPTSQEIVSRIGNAAAAGAVGGLALGGAAHTVKAFRDAIPDVSLQIGDRLAPSMDMTDEIMARHDAGEDITALQDVDDGADFGPGLDFQTKANMRDRPAHIKFHGAALKDSVARQLGHLSGDASVRAQLGYSPLKEGSLREQVARLNFDTAVQDPTYEPRSKAEIEMMLLNAQDLVEAAQPDSFGELDPISEAFDNLHPSLFKIMFPGNKPQAKDELWGRVINAQHNLQYLDDVPNVLEPPQYNKIVTLRDKAEFEAKQQFPDDPAAREQYVRREGERLWDEKFGLNTQNQWGMQYEQLIKEQNKKPKDQDKKKIRGLEKELRGLEAEMEKLTASRPIYEYDAQGRVTKTDRTAPANRELSLYDRNDPASFLDNYETIMGHDDAAAMEFTLRDKVRIPKKPKQSILRRLGGRKIKSEYEATVGDGKTVVNFINLLQAAGKQRYAAKEAMQFDIDNLPMEEQRGYMKDLGETLMVGFDLLQEEEARLAARDKRDPEFTFNDLVQVLSTQPDVKVRGKGDGAIRLGHLHKVMKATKSGKPAEYEYWEPEEATQDAGDISEQPAPNETIRQRRSGTTLPIDKRESRAPTKFEEYRFPGVQERELMFKARRDSIKGDLDRIKQQIQEVTLAAKADETKSEKAKEEQKWGLEDAIEKQAELLEELKTAPKEDYARLASRVDELQRQIMTAKDVGRDFKAERQDLIRKGIVAKVKAAEASNMLDTGGIFVTNLDAYDFETLKYDLKRENSDEENPGGIVTIQTKKTVDFGEVGDIVVMPGPTPVAGKYWRGDKEIEVPLGVGKEKLYEIVDRTRLKGKEKLARIRYIFEPYGWSGEQEVRVVKWERPPNARNKKGGPVYRLVRNKDTGEEMRVRIVESRPNEYKIKKVGDTFTQPTLPTSLDVGDDLEAQVRAAVKEGRLEVSEEILNNLRSFRENMYDAEHKKLDAGYPEGFLHQLWKDGKLPPARSMTFRGDGTPRQSQAAFNRMQRKLVQLSDAVKLPHKVYMIDEKRARKLVPSEWRRSMDDGSLHGFTTPVNNGKIGIYIHTGLSKELQDETILHEFGHAILRSLADTMDGRTAYNFLQAHQRWSKKVSEGTVEKLIKSKKTPQAAVKYLTMLQQGPVGSLSKEHQEYLLDFEEWFADNVATWMHSQEKPRNGVQRFFKAVADFLKRAINTVSPTHYSMNAYMTGLFRQGRNKQPGQLLNMHALTSGSLDRAAASVVASNAPMSGARRDAVDHMFIETLTQEDRNTLMRAANTAYVRNQLDEVMTEDDSNFNAYTRARAMAYHWLQGSINVGPSTNTALKKLHKWVRDQLGIVGDMENAEEVLATMAQGNAALARYTDDAPISRDVESNSIAASAKNTLGTAYEAVSKPMTAMFTMIDDRVRDTKIPALIELADLIHLPQGGLKGEETIWANKQAHKGRFVSIMRRIFENAEEGDMEQALNVLYGVTAVEDTPAQVRRMVRRTRALMNEMYDYQDAAGVRISKREDYFPWVLDVDTVNDRQDEFLDMLGQEKYKKDRIGIAVTWNKRAIKDALSHFPMGYVTYDKEAQAKATYELATTGSTTWDGFLVKDLDDQSDHDVWLPMRQGTLEPYLEYTQEFEVPVRITDHSLQAGGILDVDIPDFNRGNTIPYMRFLNHRILEFVDPKEMREYLNDDLGETLQQYIGKAVKHTEYVRAFGNENEWLKNLLTQAANQGATPDQIQLAVNYVQATTGMYGYETAEWLNRKLGLDMPKPWSPINENLNKTFGAITLFQNMRYLGLATLTSLADVGGIAVRSSDFTTLVQGMRAWMRSVTNQDAGVLKDLSEMMGIIEHSEISEALGFQYEGNYMTGTMAKLNDKFFNVIGLNQLTRHTRMMALASGQAFLKKHTERPNKHTKRFMKELGVREGDVQFNDNGSLKILTYVERKNPDTPAAEIERDNRVRKALSQFVDEAILRPNPSMRTLWGSDPHYQLFQYLKSFTYAFHDRILRRFGHEMVEGNYAVAYPLLSFIPIMIVSLLLREVIQHGGDDPMRADWGLFEYVVEAADRSGLAGIYSQGIDVAKGGLDELFSPTFNTAKVIGDALTGDGDAVEKLLPLQNVF